jgi:Icc-related predicted phosphoesterase
MFKHQDEMVKTLSDIGIELLIDRGVEIDGVEFYGVPWTPVFGNWAFMKPEAELKEIWQAVPRSTDVLISHGPPYGVLDMTHFGERAGSTSHARVIQSIRPKLNCFGHIHECYGSTSIESKLWTADWKIDYVNCTLVNFQYEMVNDPVVYTLED